MEKKIFFKSETPAAFLVNGVFIESGDCITALPDCALYATVLPTDAAFLPYTAKLSFDGVISCSGLVTGVRLSRDSALFLFGKRYECVFSGDRGYAAIRNGDCGVAGELFSAIRLGDLNKARKMLSPELSGLLSDSDLTEFFAPYKLIVKNSGFLRQENADFLLVDKQNNAAAFRFVIEGGLISDIEECEQTKKDW